MARVIPSGMVTELAKSGRLTGECLILAARDGLRAGFTTLDRTQSVDLGLGAGAESCGYGMTVSALTLACGLDASFAEVTGPLGPVLTRAEVEGGRWTDALAWLVQVNPGLTGFTPLLGGKVRQARCEGRAFILEIRNQGDALAQSLGAEINAYCRWRFGSSQCGGTPVTAAAAVTAVTSALRFSVSFAGTFADGFFNQGEALFTSGALAGVTSENIFQWISLGAGAGTLVLWEPLRAAPAVGAALTLTQGCPKTRPACIVRQGNALRFGGDPDAVGTDQLLRAPNPGGG